MASKIRALLLWPKELLPYRGVSVICKSFLSKMFLLMFLIVFRKVDLPLDNKDSKEGNKLKFQYHYHNCKLG